MILPYVSNANAYESKTGIFAFFVVSNGSNLPVAEDGVILQIRARDDALFQVYFSGWNNLVYYRRKWGTTWSGWQLLRNN